MPEKLAAVPAAAVDAASINIRRNGYLEIGSDDNGEVVIRYHDLTPDENGVGHIVFSVSQARNLAKILYRQARLAKKQDGVREAATVVALGVIA